jgi:hypothetical protein
MKRILLSIAIVMAMVVSSLATPSTAEARWGWRGGYYGARPYGYGYGYGYRPYYYGNYAYGNYAYRPYYASPGFYSRPYYYGYPGSSYGYGYPGYGYGYYPGFRTGVYVY